MARKKIWSEGALNLHFPENRWDEGRAAAMSIPDLLIYRSNLLGSSLAITNFGGGNTSAKIPMKDHITGELVEVLWVKASGGDLGSATLDNFATLSQEKLLLLEGMYEGLEHEDDMVDYLAHCLFGLNRCAPSIDTPLHAFLPFKHVDHVHPDAVIAIAATSDSKALTYEVFEGKLGWLPWQRPGFDLGLKLRDHVSKNPAIEGIVLAGHGLFTWADTSSQCYEVTLGAIQKAVRHINGCLSAQVSFGGLSTPPENEKQRRDIAVKIMPAIRACIGADKSRVGHFNDSDEALEFVGSKQCEALASVGTSCPDHFLRTKIRPLVLHSSSFEEGGLEYLDRCLGNYGKEYSAYYARCKHADSPTMRNPSPVVYLVPGVGIITFADDKPTARVANEFYINAINVMRGASALSTYVGLDEQEAFNIEYWRLEEAKLQRLPKRKPLCGQVAMVTGAAGGIGQAVAIKLLNQGACVVLTDISEVRLDKAAQNLSNEFGQDNVRSVVCDVTDEQSVARSLSFVVLEFGGIDILVANAGIASSAPVDETSLADWQRNFSILSQGYFLAAREAFRIMKVQKSGSIIFVVSKNALAASPNVAAYGAAKASSLHLGRCLALDGAPYGIRVNVVNPDAVLKGSSIWNSSWKEDRAAAYGIDTDRLQDYYRNRSLLKLPVYPEDVAEAVYYFASPSSLKSTGNILNVDAGNVTAFPR